MNIFKFTNYREIIKELIFRQKEHDIKFGFTQIAKIARVQKPYVSKVMAGDASFSHDQIYLLAKFFKLDLEARDFLNLLLERERTALPERQSELDAKIKKIVDDHRDTSQHTKAKVITTKTNEHAYDEYYLDPLCQIIHLAMTIDSIRSNPKSLIALLGIEPARLKDIIEKLERMNFLRFQNREYQVDIPHFHLKRDSHLYRSWNNQIKLAGLRRLDQLHTDNQYSFCTLFSASENDRAVIHNHFLDFLKSCENLVQESSNPNRVYQMGFDLFPWI